jgi:DNA-binding response OmpR family regulator
VDQTLILIVDPDPEARALIAKSLGVPSVITSEVATASDAVAFVSETRPDLIILDANLPDISGLGLCRLLRETPDTASTPIVVLSAQDSEIDRIMAFETGADDFIAKPFYPPELAARIGAIRRGLSSRSRGRRLEEGELPLSINRRSRLTEVSGRRVDLTQKEFDLLAALVSRPGRVVRRIELIETVWGKDAPHSARAVDAHIKSIRRKLGAAGSSIETVRGVGYRFVEPPRNGTTQGPEEVGPLEKATRAVTGCDEIATDR